jgi:hypothetical protein
VTTDAVGYHRDERDALIRNEARSIRKAGVVQLDVLLERTEEKVILVHLPHLPRMSQAVDIDLIVERTPAGPFFRHICDILATCHAPSQQLAQM